MTLLHSISYYSLSLSHEKMDIFTPQERSAVMSRIRGKNTKPEMILRKALFARGFRYRLYGKLPGKPDIVLKRYKTVIFVNGCFWHGHADCKFAGIPKSNTVFWRDKILANRHRDQLHTLQLEALGWNVLTVWECEIKQKEALGALVSRISENLKAQLRNSRKVKKYTYPTYEEALAVVAEEETNYLPTTFTP